MGSQVGVNTPVFFTWVLESRVQVLTRQTLYQLGRLPRPKHTRFLCPMPTALSPPWDPLTLIGWGHLLG